MTTDTAAIAAAPSPAYARRRPSLARRALAAVAGRERLLFVAVIVLQLAPIWAFTYLPTTDGAAHVANADVIRKYHDPALGVFRKYYEIAPTPTPNLIGHALLAGLMYGVSGVVAEKILLSLYVVAFPLALRYAATGVRRRAAWVAFLAFPLTYGYVLAQGFYNFCLSLAAFFLVVGFWTRARDRMSPGRAVVLGLLSLVLYACHLFSLSIACALMGGMTVWHLILTQRRDRAAVRPAFTRAVLTAAALVPAVVLAAIFRPSTKVPYLPPAEQWSPKEDLLCFFQFRALVSYRDAETWLAGLVVTLIGGLVLLAMATKLARRAWRTWDALLLLAAACFAGYLKAHDPTSIHFYVPQRLMLYTFLVLILWLAGQPVAARARQAVPPLAALLACAFAASHALKYREFAPQLRDFVLAGDVVARNTTFLPLIFAPQGRNPQGRPSSIDVAPFYMASGYIAARRDAVDLRNYEANTDHFPVRFRPDINPYTKLAVGRGLDQIPPVIDIPKFRQAGGDIDTVLLWGVSADQDQDPATQSLYAHLRENGYTRVTVPDVTLTQVWRKR